MSELNINDLVETIIYLTVIIVQQKLYQSLEKLKELKVSPLDLSNRNILNPEILRHDCLYSTLWALSVCH